jgi:hypothetical protein
LSAPQILRKFSQIDRKTPPQTSRMNFFFHPSGCRSDAILHLNAAPQNGVSFLTMQLHRKREKYN